jgi:hypothetical protein
LDKRCRISSCSNNAAEGFKTCDDPEHRRIDLQRQERNKASFQLKQRLKKMKITQIHDSLPDAEAAPVEGDSDDEEDEGDDPVHKSDAGNQPEKLLTRFVRRRTHNEQIAVTSCGITTGRATMFGAESNSGVKVSLLSVTVYPFVAHILFQDLLKSTYDFNRDNLPDALMYDNNCQLQSHLQAEGDTFFQRCILAVDVFHFKSKHKITDEFCQKHCNPALWKELLNEDGTWVFNSSAAEQCNVWLQGYQAIVREMLAYRYEFFLDEVIMRRNEIMIEKLKIAGKAPYRVPLAGRSAQAQDIIMST